MIAPEHRSTGRDVQDDAYHRFVLVVIGFLLPRRFLKPDSRSRAPLSLLTSLSWQCACLVQFATVLMARRCDWFLVGVRFGFSKTRGADERRADVRRRRQLAQMDQLPIMALTISLAAGSFPGCDGGLVAALRESPSQK